MTNEEHLINQHILEYESRLKHIDELLEKAESNSKGDEAQVEQAEDLKNLKEKRIELKNYIDSVKTMSVDHWEKDAINMAGPMAVWDAVAQQLEKLVEGKK